MSGAGAACPAARRAASADWATAADALDAQGWATLPKLLSSEESQMSAEMRPSEASASRPLAP